MNQQFIFPVFDRTQEPSPDLNKKETSRTNKGEKYAGSQLVISVKSNGKPKHLKHKPQLHSLVRLRMQKWYYHQIKIHTIT